MQTREGRKQADNCMRTLQNGNGSLRASLFPNQSLDSQLCTDPAPYSGISLGLSPADFQGFQFSSSGNSLLGQNNCQFCSDHIKNDLLSTFCTSFLFSVTGSLCQLPMSDHALRSCPAPLHGWAPAFVPFSFLRSRVLTGHPVGPALIDASAACLPATLLDSSQLPAWLNCQDCKSPNNNLTPLGRDERDSCLAEFPKDIILTEPGK